MENDVFLVGEDNFQFYEFLELSFKNFKLGLPGCRGIRVLVYLCYSMAANKWTCAHAPSSLL